MSTTAIKNVGIWLFFAAIVLGYWGIVLLNWERFRTVGPVVLMSGALLSASAIACAIALTSGVLE